ncbi:MAG: cell surface protein, partial [Micrococcales bacterium]|nr:cell surface protein [Micrococcales bacterium]
MPWRRALALSAVGAVVTVGMASPANADSAPVSPANPATPATVSADSLPTVQISGGSYNNRAGGVVWTQAVVGNTVYVGGDFTRARPAGAARGVDESVRTYLLAYDVRTGALLPFNHTLDGQVQSMAVSPDGKRLYVGGAFSHVDGKWRVNIAAFNTADGSLVEAFQPVASTRVLAIAASNTTVYVGGNFLKLAPKVSTTLVDRAYLGAFNAADGSVLPWRADANSQVTAMALTKDGSRLVVGGKFNRINGASVPGLGSLSPSTAALQSFPTNQYIKVMDGNKIGPAGNGGGTVTSLVASEDGIYGGMYDFSGNVAANSEGVFRADPNTGAMIWNADCHGDVYSVYPMGGAVYAASHQHWCASIGGFGETRNQTPDYYRATAFSKAATGRVVAAQSGYTSHIGEPAPSLLTWFPQIPAGTYTGIKQGPWHVTGNDTYVVYAGEFLQVNGQAQEGLARFAVPSAAPNKVGPRLDGTKWAVPVVRSTVSGQVSAQIVANFDYDNSDLTYRLYRDSEVGGPVAEVRVSSTWFSRPSVT